MVGFLDGQQHRHGCVVMSPSLSTDRPLCVVASSAFIEGQIHISRYMGCNQSPLSHAPVIVSGFPNGSMQLQGKHNWLLPSPDSILVCLQHYFACKALAPFQTSALIALPRWHRKKSWHKLTQGMILVHHLSHSADHFSDFVDFSPASVFRWSIDFWYDPPSSPMHCNFSTEEGESLMMVFPGSIQATRTQVLIDSGASHNFIDQEFCQKLGLTIHKDPGQVTCGGNATVSTQGFVHVQLQLHSYVETVKLIVLPVANPQRFRSFLASIGFANIKVKLIMAVSVSLSFTITSSISCLVASPDLITFSYLHCNFVRPFLKKVLDFMS
jgi:hypothetical protein